MFSEFIGLLDSYQSLETPTKLKEDANLVNVIAAHLNPIKGLGYFKLANRKNIEEKISDAILESNKKLSTEDKAQVVDYYEKRFKNESTKRDFYMRASLSVLLLSLSFGYLIFNKNTNQEFVKVICGFIGVILGYWFK